MCDSSCEGLIVLDWDFFDLQVSQGSRCGPLLEEEEIPGDELGQMSHFDSKVLVF